MSVDVDPIEKKTSATREIRRSGNSLVVSFPREILQSAGISEGDEVLLEADIGGDSIELRRQPPTDDSE